MVSSQVALVKDLALWRIWTRYWKRRDIARAASFAYASGSRLFNLVYSYYGMHWYVSLLNTFEFASQVFFGRIDDYAGFFPKKQPSNLHKA